MDISAVDETKLPTEHKPPVINAPLEPSPLHLPAIPASPMDAPKTEPPPASTPPAPTSFDLDRQTVERLSKVIVGQQDVIDQILIALLSGGHCLITGAPGLAKTLLVKSIARIFHLKFQRIQDRKSVV